MANDDVIANPKIVVGIDGGSIQKDANTVAAGIGAALTQAERAAAKSAKAIQGKIDNLNAVGPTRQIGVLSQAIDKMGGVSKLSGNQLERLTQQVNALAAAGAKVPKNLSNLSVPGSGALNSISSQIQGNLAGGGIGSGLAAIGPAGLAAAAGIGAVTAAATAAGAAILDFVEKGSKIQDLKERTALGAQAIQALGFVAEQSGVSVEDISGAVGKLQKTLGQAELGSEEANKALAAIGLTVKDLQGLAPEDQFAKVAAALRQIPEPEQQVALGSALMGKGFANVAALVRVDLVTAFEQARQSGTFMTDEQVKKADELGDAFTRLGKTVEALKVQIGAALLEGLGGGDAAHGVDTITNAVKGLIGIVKEPAFQTFLNVLSGWALGLAAGGVKGLAELGQFQNLPILSDKQIAEKNQVTGPDLFTELSQNQELSKKAAEAKKEQEQLAAELEREQEALRRSIIETNKEFENEDKTVAKINAEVAKRLSGASVSIFGTSKEAARDASLAFDDLNTVMQRAGKGIDDLSSNELARLEAQLVKLEPLTRADAEVNDQVATALGRVRERQREVNDEFERGHGKIQKVKRDWLEVSVSIVDAFDQLGLSSDSFFGSFLNGIGKAIQGAKQLKASIQDAMKSEGVSSFGQLSSGSKIGIGASVVGGAIGIGVDAFKGASTNAAASAAKGALGGAAKGALIGSVVPGIGTAVGAIAGGIIGGVSGYLGAKSNQKKLWAGLTDGLVQQFGSLDKAREAAAKYGIALDKALDSKNAGKLQQAIKDLSNALTKAQQDAQNRQILEQGVDAARQGAEALLGLMEKLSPKAQAAGNALVKAVSDAMVANGLGFLPSGALAKSESFNAVQGAVGAAGQITQGLRQAGGIDTNFLANAGSFTDALREQAVAAAKEAGLSDAEAQKAGLAAVAPLLKDQLNASIESGQKLSGQTQQLIDEAKANGISIVADPLIEQLEVQKDSLTELKKISGKGANVIDAGDRFINGRAVHAAAGFAGFTGSRAPAFQAHPGEFVAVLPGAGGSLAAQAGLNAISASLGGGRGGSVSVSMPVELNVSLNGSATRADADLVASSVLVALKGRHHALNAELEKRFGR